MFSLKQMAMYMAASQEVAAQSVEYPADSRILPGHAGKLTVGTVERISPYKQKHAYYIPPGNSLSRDLNSR